MALDPVCGMNVQPERAAGTSQYEGQTYYFCSSSCKRKFDEKPQQYVQPAKGKTRSWLSWLTRR